MTVTFETDEDVCSLLYEKNPSHWDADLSALGDETQLIKQNKSLNPWSTSKLAALIAEKCPDCAGASTGATALKKSSTAYIFHLVEWSNRSKVKIATATAYVPISSDWHVYQRNGLNTLQFTGFNSDGSPRIFNKKSAIVVGIHHFVNPIDLNTFGSVYNTTATQGTPQNETDLAALISALAGISGSNIQSLIPNQGPPATCPLFLAAGRQYGTDRLPFDTKVTATSGNPADLKKASDDQNNDTTNGGSSKPAEPPFQGDIKTSSTLCALATDCVDLRLAAGTSTVTVSVSGTFSGSLVFEVGQGGATYSVAEAFAPDKRDRVTNVTAPGSWTVVTAGQNDIRVRADAWNSGTAKVSISTGVPDGSKPKPATGSANSQQAKAPTQPAAGVMSCTGTLNSAPCTTTRTFTSEDPEWWDVSIGIALPGARESKYSIVNSQLTKSVTTHTDFYAMLDLYPFFRVTDKNDWAPHFNVGVPITSQSLYRPYFGLAESVGGLLSRISGAKRPLKLPVNINVFAGMVWMQTKYVTDNPTTADALASDSHSTRVWKPAFGIEVPVSSIASKIKGAGSKNSNGGGKTAGSSASSN